MLEIIISESQCARIEPTTLDLEANHATDRANDIVCDCAIFDYVASCSRKIGI